MTASRTPDTADTAHHPAIRWWRIAVLTYLPALLLSALGAFLNWDAMIEGLVSGTTGTAAPTREQAGTFLLISTAFALGMQALVAAGCWFIAGRLGRGEAARIILSVAAAVFAINAILSVTRLVGGDSSAGIVEMLVVAFIAAASGVAVYATYLAYRGDAAARA